jgi:hypothetical protein
MHKWVTLAVAGLAAGWLTLGTPSASQAQGVSFGFQFQRGGPAYGPAKGYYSGGYDAYRPDYGGYDRCDRGSYYVDAPRFDRDRDCFPRRPIVAPPDCRPCPKDRGYYDQGPIGLPPRGYYTGCRY